MLVGTADLSTLLAVCLAAYGRAPNSAATRSLHKYVTSSRSACSKSCQQLQSCSSPHQPWQETQGYWPA